jgi:PAS domain S-box-containing protein
VSDSVKDDRDEELLLLGALLDDSPNEVYLFDEDDLRFQFVNARALDNLGLTFEQTRAMTPLDLKPLFDARGLREVLAPLLDGIEERVVFRTLHRRADGSTYPVEVVVRLAPRGGRRVFIATVTDISERTKTEREHKVGEARFRALIERSLDLILLADAAGRFTFASPSVTTLLGYSPEEILRFDPLEIIHPDDQPAAGAALGATLGGEEQARLEFRVRHKDGSWRAISAIAHNLLDHPAVGAIVMNARDVTEERRLAEQLRQSQKLESIGRLAGGIAHDFNNILTTILSSAAFLEEDSARGPINAEDVREIQNAAERASALTAQLLAFARKRVIRPQTLHLGEIVRHAERFLRRVLGETIELATFIPEGLHAISMDPSQLDQVILNLAVNARDAMPSGGRLTLELQNVEIDEEYARGHAEVSPGSYVMLCISDTGEGITAEQLPHVFEPFFTTKPPGAGTGLGLAMVYGIVRQGGGHIWVYSEPGVGTSFKLYFPRSSDPARPALSKGAAPVATGSGRILVVEDDENVRRSVVRALEAAGYEVHAAALPQDGLAWAQAQAPRLDLLITDVVMPGMTGKELAGRIKELMPNVRVLYMSGYTENTIMHRGVLDQGVDFLEKPFAPAEMRALVIQILSRP